MKRNSQLFVMLSRVVLILMCVSAIYLTTFGQVCTPELVKQWGTEGQFNGLTGIAVDTAGNVYALDRSNRRIQKFDADGNYLLQWGGFGSNNGQFRYPNAIATDSSNNVYVADLANFCIQKFNSDGVFLTKWGSRGTGNGQFESIQGVAIDKAGNVYVTDVSHARVQKFDANGSYLTQWRCASPYGIALDQAGNIYITSRSINGTTVGVQKFDSIGNFILAWGSRGTGSGQFSTISVIAIDRSNNVYVGESQRVQQFDANGNYLTEWSTSDAGYSIRGIAVNAAGSIYVHASSVSSSNVRFECIQKYSCHPAAEDKHVFSFDNGSETWASGYASPADLFLLRYFDSSLRFGSGYGEVPTKVIPLESDDPLQPQNLLICRGVNCEEGAIISEQPGGNVVEQARWSPDAPHPVGTLLNGSWSHLVSTGKNKLLLYNNATYQAKLIYLKGVLNTDYNAAQIVKNFTIASSPFGSSFSGVINTPKGLLFYGGGIVNNRVVLDRLMTFKETYSVCNGQPCRLTVTDSSSYFVGLRAPGLLARVRNNPLFTIPSPAGDLLLSYDATSGNARLYTINTTGTPYFQQVGTTQAIGAGWTQIAGIKDEILFYHQNDYSYALGNVKASGFPVRPNLTLTREVAGSAGILGGWSHLVPLMPTI